jgi:coenzyme F420-reducing hydrogenase alpha subunit
MAKDHPEVVTDSLHLKKLGNEIVAVLGGREIHPVNVRVGGFHKVPSKKDLRPLAEKLKAGRDLAVGIVRLVAGFPFPDFTPDYELVALRHPSEYPFNEGRLVSSRGLDIAVGDYESRFAEEHVQHSNALHSSLKERGAYFVGPLARYGLNFDRLPPAVQQLAKEAGLPPVCKNPFQSIVVRAVETVYAIDEALRILTAYEPPERPWVDVPPRDGVGMACTEAPRGILYHRYRIGADGLIQEAKIVPPTSQNLRTIEDDLRLFVEKNLALPQDQLTWRCEQAVRNYDPCISCATHFLNLTIERT